MRYRAKKTLNLGSGKLCRGGQVVPLSYGRLEEAIKRGWVEPITDEEQAALASKPEQPAPSLVTIPKAGSHDAKDEGTVFLDKKADEAPSDDKKSSEAWEDTDKWKKPTGKDTTFPRESPVDSGEIDLEEVGRKEEGIEESNIGPSTLIAQLPCIHGRAIKGLKESKLVTVADLGGKTLADLIKITGIGEHTANELLKAYDEISGG